MSEKKPKKINLRKTVHLPKTPFQMRANLIDEEPKRRAAWKKANLYNQIKEKNKSLPDFVFHDGPPYANGDIHLGHLLNKVLKDFVVRSQPLLGKKCDFIPGWDCHGLPIEHKVMQQLSSENKLLSLKELPLDEQKMAIRKACASYAKSQIKTQAKQMQALLTLADYNAPYLTMTKQFEASTLNVFSQLISQGLVYRKRKPVHWSIANQTALAEAELEYYDKKDTSIYVGFKIIQNSKSTHIFKDTNTTLSLLIWTTTPWTLPANKAVAINPKISYSIVSILKDGDTKHHIVASDRISALKELFQCNIEELSQCSGKTLIGMDYLHPLTNTRNPVIDADFVTTEDGSGLVHIAPGHGTDDYLAGINHHLDVYCPVKEDGCYDNSVDKKLQSLSIWDANPVIINDLKEKKSLLHAYEYTHSYPHDWRSKTPVIFRATEQWFIGVDEPLNTTSESLRSLALDAIDKNIKFVPDWGKNRLRGMLESRPDWCISRQRSWGLPIPAFQSGTTILLTEASVNAVAKIIAEHGSDAWFNQNPAQLLQHYDAEKDPHKPADFNLNTAVKLYDIFDVWFESGSSWKAVIEDRQETFPSDLYLEGSDQHRGWFHLSLLPALGVNQAPPFKTLLTHGFIVDKDGKKMSKSLGNTLDVQDILSSYGADIARWWVSSLSYENDIKADIEFFNIAADSYRKIRNTIRFLLSNLFDYKLEPTTELNNSLQTHCDETSIEHYVLSQLQSYETQILDAYSCYQFKTAHTLIYEFCNDVLSSFYCSVTKDSLYCDASNSENRKRIQLTFHVILEKLLRLLNPILPHTSEEAFQVLHQNDSLLLSLAPEFNIKLPSPSSQWNALMIARQKAQKVLENYKEKGIENSLDAGLALPEELKVYHTDKCKLDNIFGVSRIRFHQKQSIDVDDLRNEARCERSWKRDFTVKIRENGLILSDRDAKIVENILQKESLA